jgi:hypothetical protein
MYLVSCWLVEMCPSSRDGFHSGPEIEVPKIEKLVHSIVVLRMREWQHMSFCTLACLIWILSLVCSTWMDQRQSADVGSYI